MKYFQKNCKTSNMEYVASKLMYCYRIKHCWLNTTLKISFYVWCEFSFNSLLFYAYWNNMNSIVNKVKPLLVCHCLRSPKCSLDSYMSIKCPSIKHMKSNMIQGIWQNNMLFSLVKLLKPNISSKFQISGTWSVNTVCFNLICFSSAKSPWLIYMSL